MNIKLSIPNPTTSAHLVHLSANLRIGEVFGFKVALLIGRRPRSKVSRKAIAKVEKS